MSQFARTEYDFHEFTRVFFLFLLHLLTSSQTDIEFNLFGNIWKVYFFSTLFLFATSGMLFLTFQFLADVFIYL